MTKKKKEKCEECKERIEEMVAYFQGKKVCQQCYRRLKYGYF